MNTTVLQSLKNNLPFVVYRKPNAAIITGVFQNDNSINNTPYLDVDGFVFSPFEDGRETLIIPYSNSNIREFKVENDSVDLIEKPKVDLFLADKNSHIQMVEKGINYINNSDLDKVVLSRKELVSIGDFRIVETFKKLCKN